MTTQNTSALAGTRHHVTLYIDQQAACLAGYDQYGKLERHINPSELTDRQRQTLVKLNFAIGSDQVGFPIDGSHSIETLLDAAADKLDAKQAKRAIEDAETIDKMKQRILTAPLTDIIDIDEASGQVSIKRAADTALLHLSGDRDALKRMWLDQYGIWYSPASGSSARAEAIRAAVLADSDVSARILAAEEACSLLTKRLDAAKLGGKP
jgi:hypothetical protein